MKPETSLSIGLGTGVLVWAIFQHAMPSLVDHRVGDQGDEHAATALRMASWTAAGTVSAISLLAKDPTVFTLGGAMVIALNLWHRHANAVNPSTGRAVAPGSPAEPMAPVEAVSPDMAYVG